jgi:hypothetical protein
MNLDKIKKNFKQLRFEYKLKNKTIKLFSKILISLLAIFTILVPVFNQFLLEANAKEYSLLNSPDYITGIYNISFKDKTNLISVINGVNSSKIGISSLTGYTIVKDSKNTLDNYLPFQLDYSLINQSENNKNGIELGKNVEKSFKEKYRNYIEFLKRIKEAKGIENTSLINSDEIKTYLDSFIIQDNYITNDIKENKETVIKNVENVKNQEEVKDLQVRSRQKQIQNINTLINSYSLEDLNKTLAQNNNFNLFLTNNLYIDNITVIGDFNYFKHIDNRLKNFIDFNNPKTSKTNIKELEKDIKDKQEKLEEKINIELEKNNIDRVELSTINDTVKQDNNNLNLNSSNIKDNTTLNNNINPKENKNTTNDVKDQQAKIINDIIEKELEKEQNNIELKLNNQITTPTKEEIEILTKITPTQIQEIDNKIKLDEKGNNVIRLIDIDNTNGIDSKEARIIKKQIDNTNKESQIFKEINMLSPIMHYSLTNKANELNLVEKFVGMFGGKVEVGAFWGWDASLNINWCRGWWNSWYPCGLRVYMNRVMYNALFAVGSGQLAAATTFVKGNQLYLFLARFTWMCGSFIAHCNGVLWGLSFAIIIYMAARAASFENHCRQNMDRSGISFELSWSGGVKWFWCSNK